MTSIPQSIIIRFEVISAMLHQIQQLPEWEQYCEEANFGLTSEDRDYAINEKDFASLESNIINFLQQGETNLMTPEKSEEIKQAVQEKVMFFSETSQIS